MNFGEIIKKLRRNKDMTQEQLAEYLNISTQAVSKWETNMSLPDITLIPAIANIFDTSADVLLGIDIHIKEKRIEEIVDRSTKLWSVAHIEEASAILREGLKEYPNSYKIMSSLMLCLWRERDNKESIEKRNKMTDEVVELGEKILAECTDNDYRRNAIQILCYTYPEIGEKEKAIELAKKMPSTYLSRENLLSRIYSGTERFEAFRRNIFDNINLIVSDIQCTACTLDNGNLPYTTEEHIDVLKKIIAILEIVIEDSNYGFYRQQMAWTHIDIAKLYADICDYDKAIEALQIASFHSIKNDEEYDPENKYTCLLFRGMKYGGISHSITENDSMHQIQEMKYSAFEPIRNRQDFISIEETLKKHAANR